MSIKNNPFKPQKILQITFWSSILILIHFLWFINIASNVNGIDTMAVITYSAVTEFASR